MEISSNYVIKKKNLIFLDIYILIVRFETKLKEIRIKNIYKREFFFFFSGEIELFDVDYQEKRKRKGIGENRVEKY